MERGAARGRRGRQRRRRQASGRRREADWQQKACLSGVGVVRQVRTLLLQELRVCRGSRRQRSAAGAAGAGGWLAAAARAGRPAGVRLASGAGGECMHAATRSLRSPPAPGRRAQLALHTLCNGLGAGSIPVAPAMLARSLWCAAVSWPMASACGGEGSKAAVSGVGWAASIPLARERAAGERQQAAESVRQVRLAVGGASMRGRRSRAEGRAEPGNEQPNTSTPLWASPGRRRRRGRCRLAPVGSGGRQGGRRAERRRPSGAGGRRPAGSELGLPPHCARPSACARCRHNQPSCWGEACGAGWQSSETVPTHENPSALLPPRWRLCSPLIAQAGCAGGVHGRELAQAVRAAPSPTAPCPWRCLFGELCELSGWRGMLGLWR